MAVNNSRSERVRAFYSTRKKLQVGLIQVNDDEERNGGQAGRVYGCQLLVTGGIQSGLKDVREQ